MLAGDLRTGLQAPTGLGTHSEADGDSKNKTPRMGCFVFLEAPPRFGLGVKVLQTSALPLGYGAG